jgi:hypothetical protein
MRRGVGDALVGDLMDGVSGSSLRHSVLGITVGTSASDVRRKLGSHSRPWPRPDSPVGRITLVSRGRHSTHSTSAWTRAVVSRGS